MVKRREKYSLFVHRKVLILHTIQQTAINNEIDVQQSIEDFPFCSTNYIYGYINYILLDDKSS